MKTLTCVVPSYNAEPHLHRCLDSILPAASDVEVIVVDDGSTDATAAIGQRYAERYPGVVRVISKPNGGHGSAVNAGIAAARGTYLKVVDSDDWVERDALEALLNVLRTEDLDLVVTNFVYEKQGKTNKHVMRYGSLLPTDGSFGWDAFGRFSGSKALLMHSLCYRTDVLRTSGLVLPEHTFYVDNLYAFVPLPHTRRLRYLDVDLYRYFIGRDDQSVNEKVMLTRIDQQLRVNRLMIEALPEPDQVPGPLRAYMVHYLGLVCAVSSILCIRSGTEENLAHKRALWHDLRASDRRAHRTLRRSTVGRLVHLPGRSGRRVSVLAYQAARRVIGFN